MLVFVAQLLLAFTHEGALVLLLAIVATLAPRGLRSTPFVRAATCLIIILIMATISKIALPPDDYYASAFWRAALHFFDLEIFKVRAVLLLLAALIAYELSWRRCLSGHRGELASTRSEFCLDCFPPTGCTLIIRCTLAAVTIFGLCDPYSSARRCGGLGCHDQRRDSLCTVGQPSERLFFTRWSNALRRRFRLCRGVFNTCR